MRCRRPAPNRRDDLVGRVCAFECVLGHQGHDGIDRRIKRIDAIEMRLDDLARRKLPRPDQRREVAS